jgi:hypothetical protein
MECFICYEPLDDRSASCLVCRHCVARPELLCAQCVGRCAKCFICRTITKHEQPAGRQALFFRRMRRRGARNEEDISFLFRQVQQFQEILLNLLQR